MTHCDFSVKSARDEMKHIIGSSELDVIIGSDRDQNRECRKKDKDHMEFLCELNEAQVGPLSIFHLPLMFARLLLLLVLFQLFLHCLSNFGEPTIPVRSSSSRLCCPRQPERVDACFGI